MPRLIDCSNVYGDEFYKQSDLDKMNDELSVLEQKLLRLE